MLIKIFLDARCVGKTISYTSKVLILEDSLICNDCDKKLQMYHYGQLVDAMDSLNDLYMDDFGFDEFDMEDFTKEKDFVPKNYSNINSLPEVIKEKPKNKSFNFNKSYNNVIKKVIGQDEPIKCVMSTITRNHMTDNPQFKSNLFLIGGTRKW